MCMSLSLSQMHACCRDVQLAALLLYHAKLGLHSEWHPYIQTLPTNFNTLLHWEDSELSELQLGSTTTESDFLSQARLASHGLALRPFVLLLPACWTASLLCWDKVSNMCPAREGTCDEIGTFVRNCVGPLCEGSNQIRHDLNYNR